MLATLGAFSISDQIRPLGYTDEQIGRIGLASTLISCVVSISLGLITDRLKHKMKAIIITLLLVSTGSFIWLMLMCLPGSQANTSSNQMSLSHQWSYLVTIIMWSI